MNGTVLTEKWTRYVYPNQLIAIFAWTHGTLCAGWDFFVTWWVTAEGQNFVFLPENDNFALILWK